jgi:heavy metal sensor kinase
VHEAEGEAQVFYRSPDTARLDFPVDSLASGAFPVAGGFETLTPGSGRFRVYSEPYQSRAGRHGVIRIAEDLGDIVEPLKTLRVTFFVMAPLAIALSVLGGYWLAGKALQPVDQITRLAREISADRLEGRIPDSGARDEIGRLVATLNEMIARLDTSFAGMKRFTADASHELRGPLTTMRSAIDVSLSQPRDTGDYQAVLRSVGEDVDRLRSITEELLVLARADAGRQRLDHDDVRLDVVASETAESLRSPARAANVVIDVQANSPVIMTGDERWLRHLVSNLIDNAVKFSARPHDSDPARVTISVSHRDGHDRLVVSDDGPGIPPEALDHVFERFFRVEGARPYTPVSGFGLGLSIAAWIVNAHGGVIEARNRTEGGSEFEVRFASGPSRPAA